MNIGVHGRMEKVHGSLGTWHDAIFPLKSLEVDAFYAHCDLEGRPRSRDMKWMASALVLPRPLGIMSMPLAVA